jgi:ABC-type sugar transport system substrate-binding protein
VGFDETDATQAGVESGAIYSSILQSQYRCGYETARLLLDAIRGIEDKGPMSGPRLTALPIFVMRASNMQDLRVNHVIHQPRSTAS